MLLRALTQAFLHSSQQHLPVSSKVMNSPPLPQPDSPRAQPSTLLLTADPSLLTTCVLLKPWKLTSGLFLPPHNFQNPLYSTLFVKGYLGRILFVCVCACVCGCVHVRATFQNALYSTLFVQGYLGWFPFLFLCVCVCTCACMHCYPS